MDLEFELSGGVFDLKEGDIPRFIEGIKDKLITSAREYILRELDNSTMLASMVGQAPDPEALKTIIRGIKVIYEGGADPGIVVEFDDQYGHWYGGEELPEEVDTQLNKILEEALNKWNNSGQIDQIIENMCWEEE